MLKESEIAQFSSVTYDQTTDDVYITFKVCDENYKDFAMRWASRKNGKLIIRGDKLYVIDENIGNEHADF